MSGHKTDSSDLIETFKVINDIYNIKTDLFLEFDEGGEKDASSNCVKEELDLTIGSLFLMRIWLLESGTSCLTVLLTGGPVRPVLDILMAAGLITSAIWAALAC